MKSHVIFILVLLLSVFNQTFMPTAKAQSVDMKGAWQTDKLGHQTTMICSEKYFSVAGYDLESKQFVATHGGSYRIDGQELVTTIEFHSMNPELVGKAIRSQIQIKEGTLTVKDESDIVSWKQIDDGTPGKLAGAWLITGRMRDGQMSKMTPGARRTMKILSGTRFQWIAYNVDTKEFSGTGGGTYTTENGKYTENIEFFSRDNSRVGQSLSFDFSLEGGNWQHKGKSSKGDPIDEVWTKREKIEL